MGFTSEIYLTKKNIKEEEWFSLIQIISHYNGIFKKWKFIITNDKNQIRYFVQSQCSLPSTMNHLEAFLLKPIAKVDLPTRKFFYPSYTMKNKNILDFINNYEIKNKGKIKYIEINFQNFLYHQRKSNVYFYLYQQEKITKYKIFFCKPAHLLAINFEEDKRYFYKNPPKYLDIHKLIPLISTDSDHALLNIDTFPYLQGNFFLNQTDFSFQKHSIIMGSSGCGKSKFISLFMKNIEKNEQLRQDYKIVVIDPHAALEQDVGGLGKVIDFKTTKDSIDLFMNSQEDTISSTELLLDLLKSLLADQYNSKLERVLRHSIHLLLQSESFQFQNLRRLLLDLEYRNQLIKDYKSQLPSSVIDFFLSDFNELKTKSYGESISPIIGFIDEMEMIPVFRSQSIQDNLKNTLQDNFLTIFSLDRTKLGDKVTKTISGLIMQQLLTVIQRREMPQHIIFIIDEVAVVENPILCRYLSESRKYHLSLILVGQYFNQISKDLQNSIFANVVNYFIFRVSKLDAITLSDNFNMSIPLDNSKDRKVQLLTELNNRECIVRIDSNGTLYPAFKATTLEYESIPRIQEEKQVIEEKSTVQTPNFSFQCNMNIPMKDILLSNSTGKKGE